MENQISENVQFNTNLSKKKKNSLWIKILWPLSLVLVAILAYVVIIFTGSDESKILQEAMRIIRTNAFFYSEDKDTLVESAVAGMTSSLNDNYAVYYT